MSALKFNPDRSTPPATLWPDLHPLWREVVRMWPLDREWSTEAALEEVARRATARREAAFERNPGLFG